MNLEREKDKFEHQDNGPHEQHGIHSQSPTTGIAAQHAVDPRATQGPIPQTGQNGTHGIGRGPELISTSNEIEVLCGPLLNYKRMSNAGTKAPTWHGSVLIVTTPGKQHPELTIRCVGPAAADKANGSGLVTGSGTFPGAKLYEDPDKAFWRFLIDVPFQNFEAKWEYSIANVVYSTGGKNRGSNTFAVPSIAQSMRILFHSCNGFSVGTDIAAWSGPALWNDVLRMHEQKPFHVMIGGGDQIYNDGVRVDGPLAEWTAIGNPHKRRGFPFNEDLRARCDEYYFKNYIDWYGTKPFSDANAQIPQLNIWDDHDIIDGFGSYTDRFMRCAVFRGIGGVAHKYYLLFQHHIPPPKSTFTTDAPVPTEAGEEGIPVDPVQLKNTFVMTGEKEDPSYIIGSKPGPYVEERSRNLYCQLGARIAFCGIDARTERTRHQINYPETYKQIFDRLSAEFAANQEIKHLVLLLGVPIAYPRLQWLENIFSSPIIAPIKFLNKRFGFAGSVFNKFDGNVDLLDDLDDHYTAHQHKHERKELVLELQNLAKKHSVRITILGGDVHLAAIGRFYSNPKLGIPAERDFRYMPNVISSAITNKPPPQAVANLLASRNKIHHLDHDTDETLLELFDHDPGHKPGEVISNGTNGKIPKKTSEKNHATMPSRNYAIIAESQEDPSAVPTTPPPAPADTANGTTPPAEETQDFVHGAPVSTPPAVKANARKPMHAGEQGAGTFHPAAAGLQPTGLCGAYGLDVTLRVEISPNDKLGHTEGYGFSVPALDAGAYLGQGTTW